jgi:hypothetical protein
MLELAAGGCFMFFTALFVFAMVDVVTSAAVWVVRKFPIGREE